MRRFVWLAVAGSALVAVAGCGDGVSAGLAGQGSGGAGGSAVNPLAPVSQPAVKTTPGACALLQRADVIAAASPYETKTMTVVVAATSTERKTPPVDQCTFYETGEFTETDGLHASLQGTAAYVKVTVGGYTYGFDPSNGQKISGYGDAAYWDVSAKDLVMLHGQDVVEVYDHLPLDVEQLPDPSIHDMQATLALAAKVMSHF